MDYLEIKGKPRELGASLSVIEHKYSHGMSESMWKGFCICALNSSLRSRDVQDIRENDLEWYFKSAVTVYRIVTALRALASSSRPELQAYLTELGYSEARSAMWDRVFSQFKLPSGIVELIRQSYSPVVLDDGSIYICATEDDMKSDPRQFIFTTYQMLNIASVYGSALVGTFRSSTWDLIPLVTQYIKSDPNQQGKGALNSALIKEYLREYREWVVGSDDNDPSDKALHIINYLHDSHIMADGDSFNPDITIDFKELAKYLNSQGVSDIYVKDADLVYNDEVALPAGYEDLIRSGQIFGHVSKIQSIRTCPIVKLVGAHTFERNQPATVVGFSKDKSIATIPSIVKAGLNVYDTSFVSRDDILRWWNDKFMNS